MFKSEIERYKALNELSEPGGIVIFGGSGDGDIPLCELKQAFALQSNLYNRSFESLAVAQAREFYDACVAELYPDTVILHIGEADVKSFSESAAGFDTTYRELIAQIRKHDKECNIVIVSLKNDSDDVAITELNKHLKYIAESEHCEFADIAVKRVWNPKETKEIVSFVYSTGFVHALTGKQPIYDLVKILFCYA